MKAIRVHRHLHPQIHDNDEDDSAFNSITASMSQPASSDTLFSPTLKVVRLTLEVRILTRSRSDLNFRPVECLPLNNLNGAFARGKSNNELGSDVPKTSFNHASFGYDQPSLYAKKGVFIPPRGVEPLYAD
jgi:hypothetical protein